MMQESEIGQAKDSLHQRVSQIVNIFITCQVDELLSAEEYLIESGSPKVL